MKNNRILNGPWTFKKVGSTETFPATVPGTVQSDLLEAGQIPDPFYRENEKDIQSIDKESWIYETTFPVRFADDERAELTFFGLDTYAEIRLDGRVLGRSDNMHRTWTFAISEELRGKTVRLEVEFESPIAEGLKRWDAAGAKLPAVNDQSDRGGIDKARVSPYVRKAGYHFGWDWGPRIVTIGIWRPVVLTSWSRSRLLPPFVRTKSIAAERATIELELAWESAAEGSIRIDVAIRASSEVVRRVSIPALAQIGANGLKTTIEIERPKLWWTNGLGEPFLYELDIELRHDDALCDATVDRFGIRTIEVRRVDDEFGKSFTFVLNGRPLFVKGANWIPNDSILPRVDAERLAAIVSSAKDAHMNMLRVWGGGIFEDDEFYALCDKNGILVWQDFLFACAMYPGDPQFLETVRAEARDNVTRLRNHPCIALWCGNNEIGTAWSFGEEGKGWGWKESFDAEQRRTLERSYFALFKELLPSVVAELHPGSFYWSTSPQTSEDENSSYDSRGGDVHYWGVWHGKEPFERFEEVLPRFMSEYGFQAFPDPWALRQFATEEDLRLDSPVMLAHQRSPNGNHLILEYMKLWYHVPRSFDHFVLMSQILQAESVRHAIEAQRRSQGRCMGTLYWQINDCWPAASWSSLDWKGRWKALHYTVRRAYEPLLLALVEKDGQVEVWFVNDTDKTVTGSLQVKLWKDSRQPAHTWSFGKLTVGSGANRVQTFPLDVLIRSKDEEARTWISAHWSSGGSVQTEKTLFFVKPKDFVQDAPKVSAKWTQDGGVWHVDVVSDALCRCLWIGTLRSGKPVYSENFVFLLPGETKRITIKEARDLQPTDFVVKSLEELQELL